MRITRPNPAGTNLNRRRFLLYSVAGSLATVLAQPLSGFVLRKFAFSVDPFALGIASGDPAPDGFVLWTRLAPDPLQGGGMPKESVEVGWEIAEDEGMKRIVRAGKTVASPDLAHSVHVEVEGLKANRWYHYRFHAGDAISPVGRTRTTPERDSLPDQLQFAFASCQHFETGYFTPYQHIVQDDLDLIVHLGDYIYEGAAAANKVRKHVGPELDLLDEYRNRHAQYKTDTDLQAAHAKFPWLLTWDDHEFDNNYSDAVSEQSGVTAEEFLRRRARAYQAYYEHMPLRKSALPIGSSLKLYRSIPYGRLAAFDVLDTRQYRTDQPCGDGNKPPCDGVFDSKATLLGAEQERWLQQQLRESPATWNVLAQQVMMARVDRAPGEKIAWSMDQWAGYDVARRRLMAFLENHKVANPVVLTGDIHTNWVNDLKIDFDDEKGSIVATEFVGTSITSGGNGSHDPTAATIVQSENPFVKFYNSERGYVRCTLNAKTWLADYRVVDTVTAQESKCSTRASFVVESGKAGAVKA